MYDSGRSNYIPTLDGWRAIAIGLVMLLHGADSIDRTLTTYGLHFGVSSGVGLLGVQVFFCLSGFLISTNLINGEQGRGFGTLKSFYIRRCFRILPAAFVFLAVAGALGAFGLIHLGLDRWLHTLLFFSNYSEAPRNYYVGHFWSLAVEEHFYMVWPLVFIALRKPALRLIFVSTAIGIIAFWRAIDFKYHIAFTDSATFWGRTDINADSLLFGVALALIFANLEWRGQIIRAFTRAWSPLLAPIFLIGSFGTMIIRGSLNWKINFALIDLQFFFIIAGITYTVVNHKAWLGRLLESRALRWVGRLSYSLYLYQQLFLVENAWLARSLAPFQIFPLNLCAAVACAILSLHLIERPMIKIGHRVARRSVAKSDAVVTLHASPKLHN